MKETANNEGIKRHLAWTENQGDQRRISPPSSSIQMRYAFKAGTGMSSLGRMISKNSDFGLVAARKNIS